MQIIRCTPQEYKDCFPAPSHVFNSVEFNELNRHKCDEVHYLLFKDDKGKVRFGIILGEKDGVLKSPFSAPFGGIEAHGCQKIEMYIGAINELIAYGQSSKYKVQIVLPPSIYDKYDNYAKQYCVAMTAGKMHICVDYNYYYTFDCEATFDKYFNRAARKNVSRALEYDWCFKSLEVTDEDIERIYGIIKINRDSHGYPLRMSIDDVLATSKIIPCTFLVLSHEDTDIAAVLAYDVTPDVSQVIYWGDVPGYSDMRPMNMLAFYTFRYFAAQGKRVLDIGPSSSDGVPSLGLCNFKESLGCHMTPKFTIEL